MSEQAGSEFQQEIKQRLESAQQEERHLYLHICDRRGPLAVETIHWEAVVEQDYVILTVTDDDGRKQNLLIKLEAINGVEIREPEFGEESSRSLGFRGRGEHPTVIQQ